MVTIDQIKQLREETGSAPTQIKKALEESNGDLDKARELLRIWGKNISIKKVSRDAKSGIIETYLHSSGKTGVLLDIRCET
ncbi:MAG: elongation factor Ts, partial [Candidatus Staskawiczbacteria bacterium]